MTEPGGVTPGRYGPRNCCLYVAAVIVAVCVAVAGNVAWSLHKSMHPKPPDMAALADSPAVRSADRAVTDATATQIAALRKATPWAEYQGTSVTDLCHAQLRSGFMTFHAAWAPVSCDRLTIVYAAFDGDILQRLRQLDSAIAPLRWRAMGPPGADPGGLVADLAYRRRLPDDASPGQSAEAARRPVSVFVQYLRPGSSPLPGHPGTLALAVSVAPRPWTPATISSDGLSDTPQGAAKRPYANDRSNRWFYRDWRPLSERALGASAYTKHSYLLAFALSSTYVDGSTGSKPDVRRAAVDRDAVTP